MAQNDFFKKWHLISCGSDVLDENVSELEDITFLREQLKNRDEVFNSLLQQLAKRDVVVKCNNVSSNETSNKNHCSLVSNHKVQQNTTHEKLLLEISIVVNETDNINAVTENKNLTAKTGNGHRHQQNRKKNSVQEQDKNQTKNSKKENQLSY